MADAPRRAEPKAWNLGQRLFGLEGKTSLVPLFLLQGLLLLWLWRGERRRGQRLQKTPANATPAQPER